MEAIIFDFDGVLIDSELPRYNILKGIFLNMGIDVGADFLPKLIGKPARTFLDENFNDNLEGKIKDKILARYQDLYLNNIENHVQPIRTTLEFVRDYSGTSKLAVASMNTRKAIIGILNKLKILDKFKVIVSREEVSKHKPDPEVYIKTAELLGLPTNNCIVVEDTHLGVEAALAAGMKCCVLLNGLNTIREFDGMKIEGFVETKEDLVKILK